MTSTPIRTTDLPAGYNTVNFFVLVTGAVEFIDFLTEVLDGEEDGDARTPDSDGLVLHAEVRVGTATIMVADSKPGWPRTPAFPQVYVDDAAEVLRRAVAAGAAVVTEVTDFVYGMHIARFRDRWGNLWWLFELPEGNLGWDEPAADDDAQWAEPDMAEDSDYVYRTLIEAMEAMARD